MNSENCLLKSCFISAPFGADLGRLPNVLDEAGIHWEWAKSDDVGYSERLPGDLRKIIRNVDFLLAVLFDKPADANTMFEVGVAVGAGKPVLLVLAAEGPLPFNLQAFQHVRASLNDETALALHLDLLIRSIERGFRYPVSLGRKRGVSPVSFGKPIIHGRPPADDLEAEVVELIEDAGGRVLLQPHHGGSAETRFAPDLLFWLPTPDADFLNPAVLEVKGYPLTQLKLSELEQQLFVFLQDTGVRTGLIVGRGVGAKPLVGLRGSPALSVFFLDYDEFRQLLKSGQLANHLRRERNRAAHGLR
jgi:hypothetical protein